MALTIIGVHQWLPVYPSVRPTIKLEHVANILVEHDSLPPLQLAEHAFNHTQTHDEPWFTYDNVEVLGERESLRSTMMGDVFTIPGAHFPQMVMPCGFSPMLELPTNHLYDYEWGQLFICPNDLCVPIRNPQNQPQRAA